MSAPGGGWTLCVDFGTAFSKAAAAPGDSWSAFDPAWVRPLMLAGDDRANPFLLESAVFVAQDRVLFGGEALRKAEIHMQQRRTALRSFKTLLSVSDLDRALNTNAPSSVDPHHIFTMRDLVVLYLGYLLAAIDRAKALDPELAGEDFAERRYAAPAWRSGDSAGLHTSVAALLGEAEALAAQAGERLLAPDGLSLADAETALEGVHGAAGAGEFALIFEATAAAAYTSIGLERSASHVVVMDIGAGTTDLAATFRSGARMYELAPARVTLKHGGDYLDGIIANLALAGGERRPERQTALWNMLARQMPEIKESVLCDGRAILRYGRRALVVKLSELEADRDFRELKAELAHAFDHSLAVACRHARQEKRGEIHAVAVGGGAGAPFVQEILRRTPADCRGIKIAQRPATPDWAHTSEYDGDLAAVFPQLAIAIGGAIAPNAMLAAGGEP